MEKEKLIKHVIDKDGNKLDAMMVGQTSDGRIIYEVRQMVVVTAKERKVGGAVRITSDKLDFSVAPPVALSQIFSKKSNREILQDIENRAKEKKASKTTTTASGKPRKPGAKKPSKTPTAAELRAELGITLKN